MDNFKVFTKPIQSMEPEAKNMQEIIDSNGNINIPTMSLDEMAKNMGMSVDDLKAMIESTPSRLDNLMKRFIENDDVRNALRGL